MRTLLVTLALAGCNTPDSSDADLAALITRVTALETENAQLRVDLAAATTRLTTLEAASTTTTSTVGALQALVSGDETAVDNRLDDVEAAIGGVQDAWISGDTTWDIGVSGDFTTLPAAWAAAQQVRLAAGATLTLALGNGNFPVSDTLTLNHPDGERIYLTGTGTSTTTITFADGGFLVDEQHRFGGLDGLAIATSEGESNNTGIWLRGSSSTHLENVSISGFFYGMQADQGSFADAVGVDVHGNQVGALVETGGILEAPALDASGNNTGVAAVYGGLIVANELDASNQGTGAVVEYGSLMQAQSSDFTSNNIGVQVYGNSYFEVVGSDFGQSSGGTAVEALADSSGSVSGSTITGTGTGVDAEDNAVVVANSLTVSTVTTPYYTAFGAVIHHP